MDLCVLYVQIIMLRGKKMGKIQGWEQSQIPGEVRTYGYKTIENPIAYIWLDSEIYGLMTKKVWLIKSDFKLIERFSTKKKAIAHMMQFMRKHPKGLRR